MPVLALSSSATHSKNDAGLEKGRGNNIFSISSFSSVAAGLKKRGGGGGGFGFALNVSLHVPSTGKAGWSYSFLKKAITAAASFSLGVAHFSPSSTESGLSYRRQERPERRKGVISLLLPPPPPFHLDSCPTRNSNQPTVVCGAIPLRRRRKKQTWKRRSWLTLGY